MDKKVQKSPETFRLPKELEKPLADYMQKENRTRSNAIITILKKFFGIH